MPDRQHSEFCRCKLCMTRKITESESEEYKTGIEATMVDRRDPDNPTSPLMKSSAVDAIIHAEQSVDMLAATGIDTNTVPGAYDYPLTDPEELIIQGTWKHRSQEAAKSGRDASVFGQLGVLLIPEDVSVVDIPKMNALAIPKEFLQKYGATLIPLKEKVPIEKALHKGLETLYLVQYDFDPRYVEKYVLHPKGGGGLFVETHPFPQIFTPLSNQCKGALILGIALGNNQFSFTGIEIPYGFTLKINSNVILN